MKFIERSISSLQSIFRFYEVEIMVALCKPLYISCSRNIRFWKLIPSSILTVFKRRWNPWCFSFGNCIFYLWIVIKKKKKKKARSCEAYKNVTVLLLSISGNVKIIYLIFKVNQTAKSFFFHEIYLKLLIVEKKSKLPFLYLICILGEHSVINI